MDASENPRFQQFMGLADKYRTMGVRTNADTPADAAVARSFGAEGIGLFRTEHMFYGKGTENALFLLRKMILSADEAERRVALNELFEYVKRDYKGTLEAMDTSVSLEIILHQAPMSCHYCIRGLWRSKCSSTCYCLS